MKAAVIGIGLIGGSFALTLKDKGICEEVIGVDNSERNRAKAVELGLVDRTLPLDEAIPAADLIVLATPVDSIPLLAVKVLNNGGRGGVWVNPRRGGVFRPVRGPPGIQ